MKPGLWPKTRVMLTENNKNTRCYGDYGKWILAIFIRVPPRRHPGDRPGGHPNPNQEEIKEAKQEAINWAG
jgi:hypothetical protein